MLPSRSTLIGIAAFVATALVLLGNAALAGAAPFA
jgi:hypothetical protein